MFTAATEHEEINFLGNTAVSCACKTQRNRTSENMIDLACEAHLTLIWAQNVFGGSSLSLKGCHLFYFRSRYRTEQHFRHNNTLWSFNVLAPFVKSNSGTPLRRIKSPGGSLTIFSGLCYLYFTILSMIIFMTFFYFLKINSSGRKDLPEMNIQNKVDHHNSRASQESEAKRELGKLLRTLAIRIRV